MKNIRQKGNSIVEKLNITVNPIPNDPLFERVYGVKSLPLSEHAAIEMDIKLPVQYANAIRRMSDESIGYSLNIESFDFNKSDDVFIIYQLLQLTIANVSIKSFECANEYELDVENKTDIRMKILTKDIKLKGTKTSIDICNPNIMIAVLNPGKRLKINSIKVIPGIGLDDARFKPFHSIALIPDLPQVPNHINIPEVIDGITDKKQIKLVDSNGFVQSSLLVRATKYKVKMIMSAIDNKSSCILILKRSSKSIISRLEYAMEKIDTEQCEEKNGELNLVLFNESSTIGELLINDIPVSKATHSKNIQNDKLIVNLVGENLKAALTKHITTIIANFNTIMEEI